MISFKRLDHVHICVLPGQLDAAKAFYTNVMGFTPIENPAVFGDTVCWFTVGGIELHVGTEPAMPQSTRHFAFEVADVVTAKTYLANKGIQTYQQSSIPGRDRFSFFDPFGNRVELLQYVS
jgi:catechol 2,3-dioxygenase-like lactoylglutathione lyase family enzyme